jgi:hypothetical protein
VINGVIISLPPEPFKSRRVGRRVNDGVPDVLVPKIILNEPRFCPLDPAKHLSIRWHSFDLRD